MFNKEVQQRIKINKIYFWFISPVSLLLIWEFASKIDLISNLFFPPPSIIFLRLIELSKQAFFLEHLSSSLKRLLLGSSLAIPFAIGIAILIEFNRVASILLKPLIAIFYPLPKLAIFPLLIVILGKGHLAQIAIIFIGVFFLVLMDTNQGVIRIIDKNFLDIVRLYKINFLNKFYYVIFRGALPEILNGIKLGLGYGLVMVVAGEFSFSRSGLGFFIWNAWDQFRIVDLYCGLFIFAIIGIIIFYVIDYLRNRLPV
jgi:ABC-type nitrate/sulfonate/bicarbonate transport system permease component